jgi:hypothetical protein
MPRQEPSTLEEARAFAAILPKTAARLLNMGINQFYSACERGEFPFARRVGQGRIIVSVPGLIRWLDADAASE